MWKNRDCKRLCALLAVLMALPAAGCTQKTEPAPSQEEGFSQYVTLGIYQGIEIPAVEVTEEQIQQEVDYMLEQNYQVEQITDRPVAQGDTVNLDYTGYLGEEPFEGGSAQGAVLTVGSGEAIPGFEEGLIGVMPGAEQEFPVTFPSDYWDKELSGAEARFTATVHYIEGERTTPQLTDELILELTGGDLKTADEYRAWLREEMERDALNQRRTQLLKVILDSSEIKGYPEERLQDMKEEIVQYYEDYAKYTYNMSLEEYASSLGQSVDAFMLQVTEAAKESVAQSMVALMIADAEKIDVTPQECDEGAAFYGYENFAEFAQYYGEDRAREVILMDKVVDTLLGLR